MREHFYIDDDIVFLNFGSFGACPKPVLAYYHTMQLECERNPVHFIAQRALSLIKDNRKALAKYINAPELDLVFVTNPSYAVNVVAKNLNLQPNDEVLTTNLEYGACDKTWEYYCHKAGAKYVKQAISLPLTTVDFFVEEFFKGVSDKTKLIFISHITSSTALIFPVQQIVDKANSMGIPSFIDGAHVPGHIPLDIEKLNCTYYTGALHKWLMAPKGCSFFYAKPEKQNELEPLIISWGYQSNFPGESQFQDYHQFNGTRDLAAFMSVKSCLNFMFEFEWHLEAEKCRKMVYENAPRFSELLNTPILAPLNKQFIGQMLSLEIKTQQPAALKELLYHRFRIEIPVMTHGDKNYLRFSMQAFNTQYDLDHLYSSLSMLKQEAVI